MHQPTSRRALTHLLAFGSLLGLSLACTTPTPEDDRVQVTRNEVLVQGADITHRVHVTATRALLDTGIELDLIAEVTDPASRACSIDSGPAGEIEMGIEIREVNGAVLESDDYRVGACDAGFVVTDAFTLDACEGGTCGATFEVRVHRTDTSGLRWDGPLRVEIGARDGLPHAGELGISWVE